MEKFQTARDVTERESNKLADVFILASKLPEPKRTQVQKLCHDYAEQVVDIEWKDMADGAYCPQARRLAVGLMKAVIDFEPVTENQKALYPQMVEDASEVWQCRRTRTNLASHGVPAIEWITLIAGAVITVFFTFFFGLENLRLQMTMTFMVALLIALNMYLVVLFGYPFSGDLSISTDSFKTTLMIFENRLSLNAPLRSDL
jgi:hypothetical protein